MKSKKRTGSYYTPKILSDFLVLHIKTKYLVDEQNLSILEPSCGDGQFVSSLVKHLNFSNYSDPIIDLVDIDSDELGLACELLVNSPICVNKINEDFLQLALSTEKKYNLIVGNPPYINTKNMEDVQKDKCSKVHLKAKKYSPKIVSDGSVKNIWPAFIEASIMALDDNGILCFVLPAEIMQVKYTKELREFIHDEFERVEVYAFNELIFEDIEQDVIALIGIKKVTNTDELGVSFYQVDSLEDLKEPKFTEKFSNIHRKHLDKWTNYILSDLDLDFIETLRDSFKSVSDYCTKAEVGIVTAANDYFIISHSKVLDFQLNEIENLIKPILPKGTALTNTICFTNEDYLNLVNGDKKVNFVHFPDKPKDELSLIENKYISIGEETIGEDGISLDKRYKMTKRRNWYHVPSGWESDGFYVKRSDGYPKILVNQAKINATDSFYRLKMKEGFSIYNLVFSFYNSLTFCLAELEGRFYGGGVLELIPNEFKNLKIPYIEVTQKQFENLDKMFRSNYSIEEILKYTDPIVLKGVDKTKIEKLKIIRKTLLHRRIKIK